MPSDLIKRRKMNSEDKETKICKKCGRELPLERFRLASANGIKYYRGSCLECDALYDKEYSMKKMEKEFAFSDNMKMLISREYKEINPARILDISSLRIIPIGTDEIFVKLMDYKDTYAFCLDEYFRRIKGDKVSKNSLNYAIG